jgi:endoglucanase
MNRHHKIAIKPLSLMIGLLSLATLDAAAEIGNPRVNQLGYLPNGSKIATYKTTSTSAQTWQLKQNGTIIATGQTTNFGSDAASGDNLQQIDLSNISATGAGFTLSVGSDQSYPFAINANVFKPTLYDSLKYFYHNRSGIQIAAQYTGGGNGSYASDSKWSRPAGHLNAGANKGDMNVPCWTNTCNYTLNVTKGWYDAGDHGKYVVNGGISVWTLLNMYERGIAFGPVNSSLGDGKLNIPESTNGVPDILDEARWEMEFLLAMQVPVGQAKAGMVHHKMHDVGWTGFPLAPHEDSQQRALVPPSTAATLNLAAVAAQSARIWKDLDSGFAAACLTAATRAWDAAQANPADIYSGNYDNGGGGYGDKTVSDEFYWAAVELYLTTGDSKYLATINNYSITRTDFGWADTELAGLASLATVATTHSASLRTTAQQKIVAISNTNLTTQASSGYGAPMSTLEYYWGSNGAISNKLILMGLAYDFTKNSSFAQGVGKGLDYLYGRNPLSLSYVTGTGTKAVAQPHHRFWSGVKNGSYPWAPPGALAGGANSGLEDSAAAAALSGCKSKPATCFVDNIDAYSVNEVTINWNAPLAWVLAFYNDYAGSNGDSSSSAATSSSSTPSSSSSVATSTSSSRTSTSTSTSTSSSRPSSTSSSSSSSSVSGGEQCNWYGTLYPLCVTTTSGWGYENGRSCISRSTCAGQPAPYGIVGTASSSSVATSSSIPATSSSRTSSSVATSTSSSVVTSSSAPATSTSSSSSSSKPATNKCQFVLSNEWNTGFTAAIRINNPSATAVNGWSVTFTFPDGSKITNSWNANITGNNPYTATNMPYNGVIQPNQSIEIGFQGTKGSSGNVQTPTISGAVCN